MQNSNEYTVTLPIFDLTKIDFNQEGFLFYPCAGTDLHLPLSLFLPVIDFFMFADTIYFDPRRSGVMSAFPLSQHQDYAQLFDKADLIHTKKYGKFIENDGFDITPCSYVEHYRVGTRRFGITRRRGYGVSCLRLEVPHISIFFYRGDSMGEGGSGNPWLSARLFVKVLARMHDQGLIVTDGSQTCGSRQYAPFAQFHRQDPTDKHLKNFLASKPVFQDNWGNNFECIGYVGMRYGPTLVWKYHQSEAFKQVVSEIDESLRSEYTLEHQARKSHVGKLARKLRKQAKKLNILNVSI